MTFDGFDHKFTTGFLVGRHDQSIYSDSHILKNIILNFLQRSPVYSKPIAEMKARICEGQKCSTYDLRMTSSA